ncbi:MAG TPA: class I tRNA ligase family protein, partial [Clostridia bacterium]|nr:class I tRNA ligase family protein [Clostridia bacterium]
KLLHPFMPFVTEEIYSMLPGERGSLMLSDWPQTSTDLDFSEESGQMQGIMDIIRAVRNLRAEMNVQAGRRTSLSL